MEKEESQSKNWYSEKAAWKTEKIKDDSNYERRAAKELNAIYIGGFKQSFDVITAKVFIRSEKLKTKKSYSSVKRILKNNNFVILNEDSKNLSLEAALPFKKIEVKKPSGKEISLSEKAHKAFSPVLCEHIYYSEYLLRERIEDLSIEEIEALSSLRENFRNKMNMANHVLLCSIYKKFSLVDDIRLPSIEDMLLDIDHLFLAFDDGYIVLEKKEFNERLEYKKHSGNLIKIQFK